jgi:hypothetical protein
VLEVQEREQERVVSSAFLSKIKHEKLPNDMEAHKNILNELQKIFFFDQAMGVLKNF